MFVSVAEQPSSTNVCGTIPLSPADAVLFYGKDASRTGRIDLSNASDDALQHLAETCDAATFGVDQKDVLDETYRKAGKLDAERSGLVDAVRTNLLEGDEQQRAVSAELFKLNVYGKDSLFKPHLDTPRGETMFGSLVIVFPTPHTGGVLALRHNAHEWTFDSAAAVSAHAAPHVAYVAFYSDVEHEVACVTAGHRVTVTYNLYFAAPPRAAVHAHPLEAEFGRLLADPAFLPGGGHVMFGLRHQYPVDLDKGYWWHGDREALQALAAYLKGSDAVRQVCDALGLLTTLLLVFEDGDIDWDNDDEDTVETDMKLVACEGPVSLTACSYETLHEDICSAHGGKLLTAYEGERVGLEVLWATQPPKFTKLRASYIAYGNEPVLQHTYAHLCLLVRVGMIGNRETVRLARDVAEPTSSDPRM